MTDDTLQQAIAEEIGRKPAFFDARKQAEPYLLRLNDFSTPGHDAFPDYENCATLLERVRIPTDVSALFVETFRSKCEKLIIKGLSDVYNITKGNIELARQKRILGFQVLITKNTIEYRINRAVVDAAYYVSIS